MLSQMINNVLTSYFFWMWFSVFLFVTFVIERNGRIELRKEKQELVAENEKLEYFLSGYFLLRMNDQGLLEVFTSILNNYTQGKDLPKNFLHLVCGYSKCYKLMHAAVLLEMDRFARLAQEKSGYTTSKGKDLLSKQSKLIFLLEKLEGENENFGNRNNKNNFTDTPDILCEETLSRHGCGIINDA